jgi:tetratricopeptide (TPR) repeat protein
MSRPTAVHVLALAAVIVAACGKDRPKISSESVGASTPTVSGSVSTKEGGAVGVSPISYTSAESAFNRRDYTAATKMYAAYTDSNPENPWGYYMLGLSAWKAGEPAMAEAAFEHALQLDPNHRKSLFNSSRVLLETGQTKVALERIEKALSLEPMSNEGLRLLGRAKYQLGDVDGAVEAYHRAIVLDDHDVWSMNNLGLVYIEQGRSAEALPPLAYAVELRKNSPVFLNNLGTALEQAGYAEAAAKSYESALGVDSGYTKASVSLARVTAAGQQPDSGSVDLGELSARFQQDIESWRGTEVPSDSSQSQKSSEASDSITGQITGLSDSTRASVEAVSDSVGDCPADSE